MNKAIAFIKVHFLKNKPFLPITENGAVVFGEIKSQYRQVTGISSENIKKHSADFIMLASAISEDMVFVSNDKICPIVKSFIPHFRFEDWTIPC